MMSKLIDGQQEKFECLNNFGKTYLSCWYLFSVIDPTLLAGLALKGPALVRNFSLQTMVIDPIVDQSYKPSLRRKGFRPYRSYVENARDYNRAWILTTEQDLIKNERFLRAAIKNGDPQIKFMEELGFKFDFAKGHTVPSMKEISQKLERKMDDLVKAGKLKENQKLTPARIFSIEERGQKKYIAVKVSEDPPAGAMPYTGLLDSKDYYEFVAKGHWPLGEIKLGGETQASFAFHDIGHYGGFLRHPDLMAAISDFTRARVAQQNFAIPDNVTNFLFESMSVSSREKVGTLVPDFQSLGISNPLNRGPENLNFYNQKLQTTAAAEIDKMINAHHAKRESIVEEYGGLRNDVLSKTRVELEDKHLMHPYLADNPRGLLEKAQLAETPEERKAWFAKYLTAVDHSMRVDPAKVIRSLIQTDKVSKNSAMYKYACLSGAYGPETNIYSNFCR